MKLLFDLLPLLFFFGTYKLAEANGPSAAALATEHLGMLVSGGVVGAKEAPMVLATAVIIVTTLLQVCYLLARGKKVDTMLWVALGLAVVFGGATIWFHDPTFIKWKFSVLQWAIGLAFLGSQWVFKASLMQKMLGKQIDADLPPGVWRRMDLAWVPFSLLIGLLNLYFAYNFSESVWLNIKLYGGTAATFLFMIGLIVYMNKHLPPDPAADPRAPEKKAAGY